MKATVYSCTCCGEQVTVPYFFDGGVYGYTCIKKVNPSAKRSKTQGLWINVDYVEIVTEGNGGYMVATIQGKKFKDRVYSPSQTHTRNIQMRAKMLKVAEFSNGTNPTWQSLDIEQVMDNKGKLKPIAIKYKGQHFMDL